MTNIKGYAWMLANGKVTVPELRRKMNRYDVKMILEACLEFIELDDQIIEWRHTISELNGELDFC